MDFAHPFALLLLLLPPVAILVARWGNSRRASAWSALGRSSRLTATRLGRWLWVCVFLIIALSGPRIGIAPGSELPPGHDVVLLLDASRSMAAEDAVPNRLEAAKLDAAKLIRAVSREPGARISVLAFAAGLEPLCPLTDRFDAAIESLEGVKPGLVRPGGTSLGIALQGGLEVFEEVEPSGGRSVVIFSDGEDLVGFDRAVLSRYQAAKITIHAVTYGDSQVGHPIPIGPKREPLTYRGQPVLTQRSDALLKQLSENTQGVLFPVGRARADMDSLYRERIAPSETARRVTTQQPERVDRSSWFLAASLGLLASISSPKSRKAGLLAGFLLMAIGAAADPGSARDATAQGLKAYRQGEFAAALNHFQTALNHDPLSPLSRYNIASVLYQMGRFEDAERFYLQARIQADQTLAVKIDYALGNVAVASGQFSEAIGFYDGCVNSLAEGPTVARLKADARANREFAKKRLPPPTKPDAEGNRRSPEGPKPPSGDAPKSETPPEDAGHPDSQPSPPTPESVTKTPEPRHAPPRSIGVKPESNKSPQNRLKEMLQDVKNAQSASGDNPPRPDSPSKTDRKDW